MSCMLCGKPSEHKQISSGDGKYYVCLACALQWQAWPVTCRERDNAIDALREAEVLIEQISEFIIENLENKLTDTEAMREIISVSDNPKEVRLRVKALLILEHRKMTESEKLEHES